MVDLLLLFTVFLNDSKALLYMYLYFFPGHLDVSGKLAKVYHLAFISVFKKGSI